MLTDPYTSAAQLCDDYGIVRSGPMHHGTDYTCTGHAHHGGEHIRCTGPAHTREPISPMLRDNKRDGLALVRIARELRDFVAGEDVPADLLEDIDAVEHIGAWLYATAPISLPMTFTTPLTFVVPGVWGGQ